MENVVAHILDLPTEPSYGHSLIMRQFMRQMRSSKNILLRVIFFVFFGYTVVPWVYYYPYGYINVGGQAPDFDRA